MSEVKTFFRHCPACGRRFEVRIVSKKLEEEDSKMGAEPREALDDSLLSRIDVRGAEMVGESLTPGESAKIRTVLEENVPVLVDEKEFRYSYQCKRCGHQWSEVHERVREMKGLPQGYTGD